jgi:hypothetical protein
MGKTIREEEFNEQYDREARLLAFPRVRILWFKIPKIRNQI